MTPKEALPDSQLACGQTGVRPPRPLTPRAQMARVMLGSVFALLVGAGPAVAWDRSSQPPRAEAPSPWPHPSPWGSAGAHVKDALAAVVRVYIPRTAHPEPRLVASAASAAPPSSSATTWSGAGRIRVGIR